MNGVVIGALMALTMVQQTDTTVAVDGATLLDVESMAGTIVVNVWERDEVRIQADHSRRTHIDVSHRGSRISVEADAERGPASRADFQITMPATMDLKVEGYMVSITVDGVMANVEAETLDGDVTVRGGRGTIKVASMSGIVLVEGAEGDIEVESAARDVRILDSSGTIVGETMGGNIVLQNVRASSVDVGSVGGHIWYDGTYQANGTYFFGSHGGGVTLVVPQGTSAQFDLSTVHGDIQDNLDGEMREADPRDVYTLEVGGGGAIVEAETFGGWIHVVRKGTEGEPPEAREWSEGMDLDFGMEMGLVDGVTDAVSSSISLALSVGLSGSWGEDWGAWADSFEDHFEDRQEHVRRVRRRESGGAR